MKLTTILGAALVVAVSASAVSALPITSMNSVRTAHDGSPSAAIVQVKSMPSRAIYHRGHRHQCSQRGLRSNHRY